MGGELLNICFQMFRARNVCPASEHLCLQTLWATVPKPGAKCCPASVHFCSERLRAIGLKRAGTWLDVQHRWGPYQFAAAGSRQLVSPCGTWLLVVSSVSSVVRWLHRK